MNTPSPFKARKNDPIPENNQARALISVEGSRPMLVVSSVGENSGLLKLLRDMAALTSSAKHPLPVAGRWRNCRNFPPW